MMRATAAVVMTLLAFHCFLVADASEQQQECVAGDEDGTCGGGGDLDEEDTNCVDEEERCVTWAKSGECDANPYFMLMKCQKSCHTCHIVNPIELSRLAEAKLKLHKVGGDERLLETMHGMEQDVEGLDPDTVQTTLQEMEVYMQQLDVQTNPKLNDLVCKNRHSNCLLKKLDADDACDGAWMQKQCAPLCQSCHTLDFNHRCPVDESIPDAVPSGYLNQLFERIVTDDTYQQQYNPTILSKPASYILDASTTSGMSKNNDSNAEVNNVTTTTTDMADGPWIVVLDNFLSAHECEHLQQLGDTQGYQPSADVGAMDYTGTMTSNINDGRTSTNAWCMTDCANDPIAQNVSHRMVQLTGIPDPNHEFLQLLKYNVGQHYGRHHDFADYHLKRQYGPRVLTVFLYLNTVEAGGGTHFSALNRTVVPQQGRAVIWPSVLSAKPREKDARTDHEALPVEAGIKFGANAWIHQQDFKEEHRKSCV
mmetsp:Transcript_30695/g.50701  ORF Transcript_30695/g.50701 Transcript_30695/m.50701 type:complete len:480 (+) Transcript_30695:37-1476(+)|eukprot:CAMPEP_0119015386 /NCGR_PEP_ID=MMETSP1176-20130426/10936_1 /TAXON_ID=265551 /ORGANISM="Synedropsis recta cf, Strain CCMP1620" /LENGTH=479 /DNA_ID=CAMNT_0006968677 /DNA_START=37 /DNA_END=1476 /DNA_ORIENTATION=-